MRILISIKVLLLRFACFHFSSPAIRMWAMTSFQQEDGNNNTVSSESVSGGRERKEPESIECKCEIYYPWYYLGSK